MPTPIKTLIVDDEVIARQVLRQELDLIPEIEIVGEAENGREALREILNSPPDLLFLDLQMPGMSGFEMIRHLSGTRLPAIVIVTAYNHHAIEAFEAGAVDYLLKPVRADRLHKAVERAKGILRKPPEIAQDLAKISPLELEALNTPPLPQKLVGRVGREYFLLDPDEVLALQADGELVWIITPKRKFLASQTLRVIESRLHPSTFQRVHRNAIVNLKHVRKMSALSSNRWLVTLTNDLEFVVSKRKAHNARKILQW